MSEMKNTPNQDSLESEIAIKFGKGLAQPFTGKDGTQYMRIQIPNRDPQDKSPWQSFVVPAKAVHENHYGKGLWMKLPLNGSTTVSRDVRTGYDESGKGIYRGFSMSVMYNPMSQMYQLTLKGAMSHQVELGSDPRGNITRIDNALAGISRRMQNVENKLNDLNQQMTTAKAELGKPFPQEEELKTKSARLAELDAKLNLDRPAAQTEKKKPEQER